jgi:hypothetical protein
MMFAKQVETDTLFDHFIAEVRENPTAKDFQVADGVMSI